jgi:orotidine-5'-phosphate decarboxylase
VSGVVRFLESIVEATADLACAFKPNLGFYEALGPEGMAALQRLRARIPSDIPVIADAKRSDIGHSARMYARAVFDVLGCDAIVVNPWQGSDSVEAYLAHPGRGVYVLARTSNPGAADFQELMLDGRPLYLHVVEHAQRWRRQATLGFVVGATAPQPLQAVRRAAPEAQLLIPGLGAQGGNLEASIHYGLRPSGGGLVASASRSILYASSGPDFAEAARREAERLVRQMRQLAAAAA